MTREEAIQILSTRDAHGVLCGYTSGVTEALDMAIKALSGLKTGKWIFNPKDAIELMFTLPKCSKCGFESADCGNFCSNCGAKMRGKEE